jgi:transcriptional regulator with XRE-family HTH domain
MQETTLDYTITRKNIIPPRSEVPSSNESNNRIKIARLKKGLTIEELAEKVGVSAPVISKFENNHRIPKLNNLRKLAESLGVSVAYLGGFETLPEKTIAEKIKKTRLYYGLRQKEFAELLGVDEKTIRNWEAGTVKPTTEKLKILQSLFKVLKNSIHH